MWYEIFKLFALSDLHSTSLCWIQMFLPFAGKGYELLACQYTDNCSPGFEVTKSFG